MRSLPSASVVENQVTTGIYGERGHKRGIRFIEYDSESELVYVVYVEEISTQVTTLNEQNDDEIQEIYPRREMKIILSSDGLYLYESVQGVSDADALNYLSQQMQMEFEIERQNHIPRKTMLDYFNNRLKRVKKFKIDEIGDHPPNPGPIPGWLRDIADSFGDIIDNQENSVGRDVNADARENELAYALAETSDPDMIRGENEYGRTEELSSSGIYRHRYDSTEMSPEQESEYLLGRVDEVFGDPDHQRSSLQNDDEPPIDDQEG